MAIAGDILAVSSSRSTLVRLNPARHISDALVLDTGLYELDVSTLSIHSIERNGVELTEVSITPNTNDTFRVENGLLQIKLAAAPDSDTNVIVLTHYLFYTSYKTLFTYENPHNGTGDIVKWKPNLLNFPSVNQTISNVTQGKITLSSSNVTIENTDNDFNQYCGIEDSFFNRPIDVWLTTKKPTSERNYKRLFTGTISKLNVGTTVSISMRDQLEKLNQPALMGSDYNKAYYLKQADSYPNIREEDNGKPIPYIFTKSPVGFKSSNEITYFSGGLGLYEDVYSINESETLQAVCTDFGTSGAAVLTNANRDWGIARSSGFKTLNFGTISSATMTKNNNILDYTGNPAANKGDLLPIVTTSDHNLEVGDTFKITGATWGTAYCSVIRVTSTNIICMATSTTGGLIQATVTFPNKDYYTGYTYHTNNYPAISIINGSNTIIPMADRDFTASVTSGFMDITFTNNFEQYHTTITSLNPNNHKVHFRATSSTETTHAEAVQDMLEASGLTVDTASITQADVDLTANAVFSIPYLDQDDFSPYIDYIGDMAKSTLGYVRLKNDSVNFEYVLYSTPSSTVERNKNNTLLKNISIEYRDIVNQIVFTNKNNAVRYTDATTPDSSTTEVSNKSKYLHKVDGSLQFKHLLDDMTVRGADILAVIGSRRAVYTFDSASLDLEKVLADSLELINDSLLGTDTNRDVVITSIDKSENKVTIKAEDLGEL